MGDTKIEGTLTLPNTDGVEISPGIWLIGNPTPRPDLGKTSMACLANVGGMLAVVELSLTFKNKDKS